MSTNQKGFTLVELLVVIAITAIMAVISLPNMSQWIASRRAAAQAEQLANMLRFARSESVRLNLPVYICPVQIKKDGNPDQYCDIRYVGQGFAAFADTNQDKKYTRKTDIPLRTVILNVHNEQKRLRHQAGIIDFSGKPHSKDLIWAFLPNGTFGHAPAINGTFSFSDGRLKIALTDYSADSIESKKARASVVLVDSSGRVEVCAKSNTDSICQYSEQQ